MQLFDPTSTELRVRDSANNITTLSPHNISGLPAELRKKRKINYAHYEKNPSLDYEMTIDFLGMVRDYEKRVGKQFIYLRRLSNGDTNIAIEVEK